MASIEEIKEIIDETVNRINKEGNLSSLDTGVKFENFVASEMHDVAITKGVKVEQTGAQSFPDIILNDTFGVEVKYTKSKKWESTGNSIFEGTFVKTVTDQIYLLFGQKDENKINVRVKKYEDCLADVKVTHSPRFYIDMDIEEKNTIMSQLNTTYKDFKVLPPQEKGDRIKEFVKQNLQEGERLWWIDPEDEDKAVSPKITQYRNLTTAKKTLLLHEALILFPEVFSDRENKMKYVDLSVHLIKEHQVADSSLRDKFSARGQKLLSVYGEKVSQVYVKLYDRARDIKLLLEELPLETLNESWEKFDVKIEEGDDREAAWLEILDSKAGGLLPRHKKASDIYRDGLKA